MNRLHRIGANTSKLVGLFRSTTKERSQWGKPMRTRHLPSKITKAMLADKYYPMHSLTSLTVNVTVYEAHCEDIIIYRFQVIEWRIRVSDFFTAPYPLKVYPELWSLSLEPGFGLSSQNVRFCLVCAILAIPFPSQTPLNKIIIWNGPGFLTQRHPYRCWQPFVRMNEKERVPTCHSSLFTPCGYCSGCGYVSPCSARGQDSTG